ncbi:putative disease resistance protein RGA4 [Pistacia vera]|uniref:putative disease resistance protein RGA4 n=1 Tax=Pistacia vera TaxID=55513 RepID=UPI00126390F0|nr:putative disease resistance protein RGA4 [Pistacia vera]
MGQEFFDYLVTRSFFQEFDIGDDGGIISSKMHGIAYNFLKFITRHECLAMEVNGDEQPSPNPDYQDEVRQSTLMLSKEASFPNSIFGFKKLRSLLVQGGVTNSSSVPQEVFGQLLLLRALDISGNLLYEDSIVDIPSTKIGKLIHLRYLNFSLLKISELPEGLCELYNLQTLEISQCINLNKLPQGMEKLTNLRHVVNDETSLNYMPKGMERLTCLRTLKEFVVSGGVNASNACSLKCLENFVYLQGSLSIRKLGYVIEKVDPGKEKPPSFVSKFRERYRRRDGKYDENVLEALQPPSTLERLEIRGYKGKTISPTWVMSLRKLRMLNLHECMNLDHLPSLGELSSLESLSISSMHVKKVDNEFLGRESVVNSPHSLFIAFPKLKALRFVNMEEWGEWEATTNAIWEEFCDSTIMPCLRSLSLLYCPKLKALPDHILQIATLNELNISWCPLLKACYDNWHRQNWDKISRIPKIMINFKYVERGKQIDIA